MSQPTTSIEVLGRDQIMSRVDSGLIVPMDSGRQGLRVVDCADDRGLTKAYYEYRISKHGYDAHPGRFFGAVSGLAIVSLIGFAAENGDEKMTRFVDEYSPEGFVDYAANLSDRAFKLPSGAVDLNQHSDDGKERNPLKLGDHKEFDDPLGCAFATKMGAVLLGSNQEWQVNEAKSILTESGTELPLDAAQEGIQILQRHIPDGFGIHRGALHHSQTKKAKFTPVAIHEGHHAPNELAKLTVDFAGYRSDANLHNEIGLHRYHHTPNLASKLLPELMPEIKLDSSILEAAGLLIATSTRLALSGQDTPEAIGIEIISKQYSSAA